MLFGRQIWISNNLSDLSARAVFTRVVSESEGRMIFKNCKVWLRGVRKFFFFLPKVCQ